MEPYELPEWLIYTQFSDHQPASDLTVICEQYLSSWTLVDANDRSKQQYAFGGVAALPFQPDEDDDWMCEVSSDGDTIFKGCPALQIS